LLDELSEANRSKAELDEVNVLERLVYAPLIGAGFALLIISYLYNSYYAKAVTITNGVYTMLGAVANNSCSFNSSVL